MSLKSWQTKSTFKDEREYLDAAFDALQSTMADDLMLLNVTTPPPPPPLPPPPSERVDVADTAAKRTRKPAARHAPKRNVQAVKPPMPPPTVAGTAPAADERRSIEAPPPLGASVAGAYVARKLEYVTREVEAETARSGGVVSAYHSLLPRQATLSQSVFDQQIVLRALAFARRGSPIAMAEDDGLDAAWIDARTIVDTHKKHLRVSRRAHEERMLRTPTADEPECAAKDKCVGHDLLCGGATLIAYFFEDEWARHERARDAKRGRSDGDDNDDDGGHDDDDDGRLPENNRLCLLDIRKQALAYRTLQEIRGAKPGAGPMVLASPLYNLSDVPGEYRLCDCVGASMEVDTGLIEPLVKLDLAAFKRVDDASTGITYFVQLLPVVKSGGQDF